MQQTADGDEDGRRNGHSVFTCDTCGSVVLCQRRYVDRIRCCDDSLREVATTSMETTTPTLETVSSEVFGLPKRGFDVYRSTSELGAATVAQVTEVLGNDRSVVTRYLNQFADVGMLEKTRRIRKEGGDVNVYYPISPTEMNQEMTLACYMWAGDAVDQLEGIYQEHADLKTSEKHGEKKLAAMFW